MDYEQELARLTWHTSQQKWHAERKGKWHLREWRWHRKQIMDRISFTFIVSHTMRKRMPALIANIAMSNQLLRRLSVRSA